MNKVLLENLKWVSGNFTVDKYKSDIEEISVVLDCKVKKKGAQRQVSLLRVEGVAASDGDLSHALFDGLWDLVLVPKKIEEAYVGEEPESADE